MAHTTVVWRDGMTFEATTNSGHRLVLDAAPPGGNDSGPRPMELLLTALAGCTAMDVLSILKKKREPVEGMQVIVEANRAQEHPKIYTEIQVLYRVRGSVNPAALVRAIEPSETKYCGVTAMLGARCRITSRFEIEPPTPVEESPNDGEDHNDEPEHIAESLP
jgi:putative redox protein